MAAKVMIFNLYLKLNTECESALFVSHQNRAPGGRIRQQVHSKTHVWRAFPECMMHHTEGFEQATKQIHYILGICSCWAADGSILMSSSSEIVPRQKI